MRAVIWCAVSSQAQAADDKVSLGEQERAARKWCAEHNHDIVAVLKVEGFSRSESDVLTAFDEFRQLGVTAYDELRRLWQNHGFDVLVAYNNSRLGRSLSLHSFVLENTVKSGAKIYFIQGGWVDESDLAFRVALGGVAATSDITRLVKARDVAMSARARRGLPTSSSVIPSHKIIRDALGKIISMEVDESKRRLWEDTATLLIEGVGWKQIEEQLYKRFGHVNEDGKQYKALRMYDWLHNPTFWGHSARHWRGSSKSDNNQKTDMWVFDPNEVPPEGVEMYYDTHEPIYTGKLAERVKAELRRRRMSIRGQNRPDRSTPFSGLFVCAECGYYLVYNGNKGYPTHGCTTKYWDGRDTQCSQFKRLPSWKFQRWLDEQLEVMIRAGEPTIFIEDTNSELNIINRRIDEIEQEIKNTDTQIRRLINKQSQVEDESLLAFYDEEIGQLSQRLKIHKANLVETKREKPNPDIERGQRRALDEIAEMSLDAFWEVGGVEMNQLLHRLFGNRRLVVKDGEIIGFLTV